MKRHYSSGITLVELLVVVTIVSILAGIAYPSYRNQVLKTNRTEARVDLMRRVQALEKCFTRYRSYNDFGNCTTAAELENEDVGMVTETGKYRITAEFEDETHFTLTATPLGSQLEDSQCGNLTINEANDRNASGPGGRAKCW